MWLVVGLGNPGKAYAETRHNVGFMVIDAISAKFSIPLKYRTKHFVYGRGFIENKDIMLIKPLTFMNRSGVAVKDALQKHRDIDTLLVVHDDLDLGVGVMRIRKNGTSGGHKGIGSIIELLGTKDFLRLKIGIGRSIRIAPEDYVLSPFPKRQQSAVKRVIDRAAIAVATILDKGVSYAQNEFHKNGLLGD